MSYTYTPEQVIERLEGLIRALEAGRDATKSFAELIPSHVKGMTSGVNIAINAIKSEIEMIRAGAAAANKILQPNNTNNEG